MRNVTKIKPISSAQAPSSVSILGTYEGECADANITNANGLDITRPVWETVFASEDYKKAIDLGWYIGFLGHPEDPNCMDFEHGCIVMTEGHIDDEGKIHGKFNLIDTPVGRVVKAFQDAGVTFGISVRGAGDIVDNSVEPDTFVFRGFDLVTFPAFPDSIPTFTAVAASTDASNRAKYQKVCAAVNTNLKDITSTETLDIIQSQFAKQSKEYAAIEARKCELKQSCNTDDVGDVTDEELEDIAAEKIRCITNLYLDQVEANRQLSSENASLRNQLKTIESSFNRKISSLKRITSSQISDIRSESEQIKRDSKSAVLQSKSENLKYKQKIDAANSEIRNKDSIISKLRAKLDETVNEVSAAKDRTSNLDASNRKLKADIKAAQKLVDEYQEAYATLYAAATGVHLEHISITASTSVKELQDIISGTSTANISSVFVEPQPVEILEDDDNAEDDLITM